jgi:flagellar FliJ protein
VKAFHFSLQRLLDAKETLERAAEEKLANAIRKLEAENDRFKKLSARLREQIKQMESFRGIKTSRYKLSVHLRYLDRLQQRLQIQANDVANAERIVEEVRAHLCAIVRERKTIEKLKEREWNEWSLQSRRLEQKEMDEFAAIGFINQRAGISAGGDRRSPETI